MTSKPTPNPGYTVFRLGPGMLVLIGMVAFGPLIHMYLAICMVVARHFDRLGFLLYTTGTMVLAATYLCAVIVGVVVLFIGNKAKKR
jgi:hypothetical protein